MAKTANRLKPGVRQASITRQARGDVGVAPGAEAGPPKVPAPKLRARAFRPEKPGFRYSVTECPWSDGGNAQGTALEREAEDRQAQGRQRHGGGDHGHGG